MRTKTTKEDYSNWKDFKTQLKQTQKYIKFMQNSIRYHQKLKIEDDQKIEDNNIQDNNTKTLPPIIKVHRRVKMMPQSRNDLVISQRQDNITLQKTRKNYSSLEPIDLGTNIVRRRKYYTSFNNMILIKNKLKQINKLKPTTCRVEDYCVSNRSVQQIILNKNERSVVNSPKKSQNTRRSLKSRQKIINQYNISLNQHANPQIQQQKINKPNKKFKEATQFDYILDLIKKKGISQFNCQQLKIRNKHISNSRSSFLMNSLNQLANNREKRLMSQIVSPSVRIITHQNLLNKQRQVELKKLTNRQNQYFKGLNLSKKLKENKRSSISCDQINKLRIEGQKTNIVENKQFCPWEQNGNSFYFTKFQNKLGFYSSLSLQ